MEDGRNPKTIDCFYRKTDSFDNIYKTDRKSIKAWLDNTIWSNRKSKPKSHFTINSVWIALIVSSVTLGYILKTIADRMERIIAFLR
jgi:hypothetical protein